MYLRCVHVWTYGYHVHINSLNCLRKLVIIASYFLNEGHMYADSGLCSNTCNRGYSLSSKKLEWMC